MIDNQTDSPFQEFLTRQEQAKGEMCRACHDRPGVHARGLCAECNAKAMQRWALTPTPEDE